jgi:hypothetical protein
MSSVPSENQPQANHLIQLEEPMLKLPSNERMNDQPTTSNNAFLLNDKPPSTHQLVVASVTNIDSQGSTNDGPTYFMQLPVQNDNRAITTLSFLHLHIHFRMIGIFHPQQTLAKNDLYPSLLHPILLTNRVYNDRQANMASIPKKCLLLLSYFIIVQA